jgi:hypothetical protein
MDIYVTRARAYQGMVVLSGLTTSTMMASSRDRRVECVIRGDQVALWRYYPATSDGLVVIIKGQREGLVLTATETVTTEQIDDVLWQATTGLSSSPVRRYGVKPHDFEDDGEGRCEHCGSRDTGGRQHLSGVGS